MHKPRKFLPSARFLIPAMISLSAVSMPALASGVERVPPATALNAQSPSGNSSPSIGLSSSALVAETTSKPRKFRFGPSTENAMKALSAKGTVVYLGAFDGIDGFLYSGIQGEKADKEIIYKTVYVSPNGQYLIDGYMIDADGRNISRMQLVAMSGGELVSDADTKLGKEEIIQSILDFKMYFDLGFLDTLRTIAFPYAVPGENQNRFNTIYLPQGGKSVIVGTAYDLDGDNVTQMQITKLIDGQKFGVEKIVAEQSAAEATVGSDASAVDARVANELDALLSGDPAPIARPANDPEAESSQEEQQGVQEPDQVDDPAASEEARKFAALSQISHFSVGGEGPDIPEINIIIDAKCPYCHDFWNKVRVLVEKKMLRLNVSMAAFKDEASVSLAATILDAKDPAAVFAQVMNGSIANSQITQLTESSREKIYATHQVMDEFDLRVSPLITFVSKDGQPTIVEGAPKDIVAFLSQVYDPEKLVAALRKQQ